MELHTIKATISRQRLKSGKYIPEALTIIQSSPMDADSESKFYEPSVKLLDLIR